MHLNKEKKLMHKESQNFAFHKIEQRLKRRLLRIFELTDLQTNRCIFL
jgi:hypothetical protein